MSLFLTVGAMAQEVNYWPTNAPTANTKKQNDRDMTSVKVGTVTYSLTADEKRMGYVDKYDNVTFQVEPGETYALEVNTGGSWIHGVVFVDFDKNGFTASVTDSWKPAEDLVAYAFYNNNGTSDASGWNSVGTVISGDNRNRPAIPSWTVPADLKPGEYRIRFKLDWCNIDPQGDADGKFSDFYDNRGSILDAKLVVKGEITKHEVTYKYSYNGNVVKTVTNEVAQGSDYPAYDLNLYGASYENIPTGTVTENTEHTINVTFNLPFEFAASYDAIGDKWYYLSIGQSAHLLYHVEGAGHIALDRTEVEKANKDAYLWAFVGSPFDGYKLVNRAKGNGWILSSSTNTFDGNTGAYTYPIMTAEPVGDGKNTYWIPTASRNLGDGGFYLAQKDANDGKNKMNNRDNKLAYWNGGADHGSTFKVRHMDAIEPVVFEWTATTGWTAVDAASCTSSLVWDNQYTGGIKYIEGSITVDTPVKADVTFTYTSGDKRLNIRGVEIIDANGNVVAGDYHVGQAGGSHIDNKYSVQVAEAGAYTVRCYATEGEYQLNGNTNNDTFDNTNGRIRVDMTRFDTKELEHNVEFKAEYATLYLGYKVAIPNGVKAYVAVSTNNGRVQFEEVTGVIPAVTPVLLENVGNSNTYEFAYTTNSAATVEKNLLQGSIANRYVTEDAYVLTADANDENGVCFGKATKNQQNNASWLNNANKAYLPATSVTGASGSTSLRFDFDGITTAIEEVETEAAETVIYDLTGRRVNEITKAGVYIINGKKILVK